MVFLKKNELYEKDISSSVGVGIDVFVLGL
jgi:hypothetical protein